MVDNTPTFSIETLAYAAGLFDGRGTIIIVCDRSASRGQRSPSHYLEVKITNTNRDVIDWFYTTFGGVIIDLSRAPSRNKLDLQPLWMWRVQRMPAQRFLQNIYPYLRVKKAQADLAIEFQDFINSHDPKTSLSQDILDAREAYKNKLSDLNKG